MQYHFLREVILVLVTTATSTGQRLPDVIRDHHEGLARYEAVLRSQLWILEADDEARGTVPLNLANSRAVQFEILRVSIAATHESWERRSSGLLPGVGVPHDLTLEGAKLGNASVALLGSPDSRMVTFEWDPAFELWEGFFMEDDRGFVRRGASRFLGVFEDWAIWDTALADAYIVGELGVFEAIGSWGRIVVSTSADGTRLSSIQHFGSSGLALSRVNYDRYHTTPDGHTLPAAGQVTIFGQSTNHYEIEASYSESLKALTVETTCEFLTKDGSAGVLFDDFFDTALPFGDTESHAAAIARRVSLREESRRAADKERYRRAQHDNEYPWFLWLGGALIAVSLVIGIKRRLSVSGTAAGCLLLGIFCSCDAPREVLGVRISPGVHQVIPMAESARAVARFRLQNTNATDVEVRLLKKSCGCMDVELIDRLSPSSVGDVAVRVKRPADGVLTGNMLLEVTRGSDVERFTLGYTVDNLQTESWDCLISPDQPTIVSGGIAHTRIIFKYRGPKPPTDYPRVTTPGSRTNMVSSWEVSPDRSSSYFAVMDVEANAESVRSKGLRIIKGSEERNLRVDLP